MQGLVSQGTLTLLLVLIIIQTPTELLMPPFVELYGSLRLLDHRGITAYLFSVLLPPGFFYVQVLDCSHAAWRACWRIHGNGFEWLSTGALADCDSSQGPHVILQITKASSARLHVVTYGA